jgi:hypothetical protein
MRVIAFALMTAAACAISLHAADPTAPIVWTAKQMKEAEQKAKAAIDPTLHRGVHRLLDSASLIYRDGPSEAEAHTEQADFITIREGEGAILIGGTILDGKPTTAGEIRGRAIDGGTRHQVAAGDSLYIPKNMPHQFLVEPGKHFIVTIVKITPRP